ncbi:hypothetical protein FHY05_004503 [Sphingomonas sp. BK580]|nr:hypothetical protein [Sphingomonas sp. BK580]
MKSANLRRLAHAKSHNDEIWEAVKWFVIEIRSQMPTRGRGTAKKPFPSIPAIVKGLNLSGYKTTRNKPINYNTISRLLTDRFDEWAAIPTAEDMENALPAPEPYVWGRFRLLEDVGEFSAGDYGQVREIVDGGVIGFFTDWDSVRIKEPEHMEISVKLHQMRMVAGNLHDWLLLPASRSL